MTPVPLMRQPAMSSLRRCTATTPLLGGASGPHSTATQCMCSGVYLSMRRRLHAAMHVRRHEQERVDNANAAHAGTQADMPRCDEAWR